MNDSIRGELVRRAKKDQAMRTEALKHPLKWDDSIDRSNTKYLKQVVEEDGWPTISSVGPEASQSAWLIVQHANHDLAFQKRALALMYNLSEGEIKPANIAYLEDRVRINQGLPQRYGTQFQGYGRGFGPYPIEDEANLDKRRAAMGMEPFSQYKQTMIARYTHKKTAQPPKDKGKV